MAGARRRLRPLRVVRLSTIALILRAAPVPAGPGAWVTGSMPANPLEAAAAMLPRAEVARAIAVAACKACEAFESSSAEPGDWYLDGRAAGTAAPSSGAGVPAAAAPDCGRARGPGPSSCWTCSRETVGEAA